MNRYYMVYYNGTNALKNKAHEAFCDTIKDFDRLAFDNLSSLINQLNLHTNAINTAHKRCKPIVLRFGDVKMGKMKTIPIYSGTGVSAFILELEIRN